MEQLKVVVVDGDHSVIESTCQLLSQEKRLTIAGCAEDGLSAYQVIKECQPDIVILEMILPYFDGLTLMSKILSEKDIINPAFFVCSKIGDGGIVAEAFRLGVCYYIQKPFYSETFRKAILYMINCILADKRKARKKHRRMRSGIEKIIGTMLEELGFRPDTRGYEYIIRAILLVAEDADKINAVTKELYPEVAALCQTRSACVERAIRYSFDVAWENGNVDKMTQFFGYSRNHDARKPSNSEVLAVLSSQIKRYQNNYDLIGNA